MHYSSRVNRRTPASPPFSHRLFMVLAALAIAMKVLVPPGYMAGPSRANDLPFALVLCTSQGAQVVHPGEPLGPSGHDPADRGAHEAPCLFAGHALAAPPPGLVEIAAVTFVAYRPVAVRAVAHLAPGRGLAAPPLPARGPPSLLI